MAGIVPSDDLPQASKAVPADDLPDEHKGSFTEAAQRGFAAGVLGMPGDIESAVRVPFGLAAEHIPGLEKYSPALRKTILPTTSQLEQSLPGKSAGEAHPVGQAVGEGLSALPLGKPAVGSVINAAGKFGDLLSINKAQKAIGDVGEVSDKSTLGSKMFGDLKKRMDSLLQARASKEKELRAKYTAEGIPKEQEIAKDYTQFLAHQSSLHPHKEEQELIRETAENLLHDNSLHSLVLEKRRLAEIAGGKVEKYSGNQKMLAGQLSDGMDALISKHAPSYQEYNKTYASMSHDINLFQDTTLGKRITKETSEFLPDDPHFDPATVPKTAFTTKRSVQILRQISGNNEQFINAAASEHVATGLADKSASEARKWLNKNSEWLDEIPDVKKDAEKYVQRLEKVTHTQEKIRPIVNQAARGAAYTAGAGGIYFGLREAGLVP
jgi:hypothetical protein